MGSYKKQSGPGGQFSKGISSRPNFPARLGDPKSRLERHSAEFLLDFYTKRLRLNDDHSSDAGNENGNCRKSTSQRVPCLEQLENVAYHFVGEISEVLVWNLFSYFQTKTI